MNQVILILSDALRYFAAVAGMGFLGHVEVTSILQIAPPIRRLLDFPVTDTMKAMPVA